MRDSLTPIWINLETSKLWSIRSKALEKLVKTTVPTFLGISAPECRKCIKLTRQCDVETPLTLPYWLISILCLMSSSIQSTKKPSLILAKQSVRETGLNLSIFAGYCFGRGSRTPFSIGVELSPQYKSKLICPWKGHSAHMQILWQNEVESHQVKLL